MAVEATVFKAMLSMHIILQLVMIALFAVAYSYIDKMEKAGCDCAMHPYRNYIKYFPIFAMVYLVLTLLNPVFMRRNAALAFALKIAQILFTVGAFVFFILAIKYINYLVQEKCKCSEDVRREIVFYWSIVHVALIALGLLFVIVGAVVGAVFMSKVPDFKHTVVPGARAAVVDGVRDPVKSIREIPKKFRKIGRK